MSETFDTLDAAHQLQDAGMERSHAEAVAAAIRKGQGELTTTTDLSTLEARLTATLYRALWIQAAGIIAAIAALAGIAMGLASLSSGQ